MKRHILTAAVLAVGGIGLTAPAWAQQQDQAAGQAAQQAQPGQQATGAQQAQPADQAQQAADRARASAQISRSDAKQALCKSSQDTLSRDGLRNLGQRLCSADQQRLGDLSKQQQQIDQAADQLKQAYKEKYQKDLDLAANEDGVFTVVLFQIPGEAEAAARPAAERVAPEAAPGAAPSEAAKAGGLADQAQAAAASAGGRAFVIIPAAESAPAQRIAFVQEAGKWKIDVPDSMDADQLSQRLQSQMQQCAQAKDKWPTDATEAQRAIVRDILIVFAEPVGSEADSSRTPGAAAPGAGGVSR